MNYQQPNIGDTDRLNVKQACEVLGVCRNTLYAKCEEYGIEQQLPKSGGRGYYLGKDILTIWKRA